MQIINYTIKIIQISNVYWPDLGLLIKNLLDFSRSRDQRLPGFLLPKRKVPGYEVTFLAAQLRFVFHSRGFHIQNLFEVFSRCQSSSCFSWDHPFLLLLFIYVFSYFHTGDKSRLGRRYHWLAKDFSLNLYAGAWLVMCILTRHRFHPYWR
jgi:hypothetical protein